MISVASVDYCERCKCKTLHIPLPSGERACEHHPHEPSGLGYLERRERGLEPDRKFPEPPARQ
jgi:hypothetical protein